MCIINIVDDDCTYALSLATKKRQKKKRHLEMFQCKLANITIYYFLFILILINPILSKSISFSYRTCLPNTDLINIKHYHSHYNQLFRFVVQDFRLHVQYTHQYDDVEFKFGHFNLTLPHSANYDHRFQTAVDYYYEIDTWHFVNVTFDDHLSKVFISFNGDETRLIPLVDYPHKNLSTQLSVDVLLDERYNDVVCLLPYAGFDVQHKNCSINMKTCEYLTCQNSAEQYCLLFQIFDCPPFKDSECGLETRARLSRCTQNHCRNRGTCYFNVSRNITQCACPSGFAGNECQYPIDECQSNPCPNHSHCVDNPNGYTCVCDLGWTGDDCSEDIDECKTTQPCQEARACVNLPGSYKCECVDAYFGQNCEMISDPCLSEPCLNGAIQCHPILESENVVFRCTCRPGFTGHRCETNINDCEGIICPKDHTHCVDGLNSFDCQCDANYTKSADGSCVETNPCDSSPCYGNATCHNLTGGQYHCVCPPTYTGTRCDEDTNECVVLPLTCRNGGTCVNEIGSHRCFCRPGWTGPSCAKTIDYCLSQPCLRNGTCTSHITGFQCRCLSSYTGHVCQYDTNECMSNPCLNNGTCYNYDGSFHCQCRVGYFGKLCEFPPTNCSALQKANVSLKCIESNTCISNDTEKLKELNELSISTCRTERERTLDAYFTCLNEESPDKCNCPSDLISCNDNAVESKPICNCQNGGTCVWLNSTNYRCYCPLGLTGPDCLNETNLCTSQPCYNNGTCISTLNKFTCLCPTYARGLYCQELIDPCESNPCLNNGQCQRENYAYKCNCSSNYNGNNCEIYQPPCSSQPCQNNGKCYDNSDNNNPTFECQCTFNYHGKYCEEQIDLCYTKTNQSLCLNGGSCEINNHTVQCLCLPGFTGLLCETNIDECYAKPCSPNGECLDLINGYQCQCQAGWHGYNCNNPINNFSKALIPRAHVLTTFRLYHSSINISKILPYRYSLLPMRIQYEFRTTLNQVSLLSIGKRFQQQLINNRIVTSLDDKAVLSTFIDNHDQWLMVIVDIQRLWIDIRIDKNSMSQRLYISPPLLEEDLQKEILFGYKNYSGCIRQIEITYNQIYSILITDQLIELNQNIGLGCKRTNACEETRCQKNELCHDHWFYHTCQCQSPFFGSQCDQIAPIVMFNQSSLMDISASSSISNISLFFNTFQPNGTIFQLISFRKQKRFSRELSSQNRSLSKVIGQLINGRFHLIMIDNEPRQQEYILINERVLNDGRPHQIQLDLDNNQLTIDRIYNESITKLNYDINPTKLQLIPYGSLDGWLQDIRINNQQISLANTTHPNEDFNVTILNMNKLEHNPCYPDNPCQNNGLCLVTSSFDYLCQCEPNWFGRNCSQIDICNYNNSSLCPNGFICKTTDYDQECLAIGTFEGNASVLIARLDYDSFISNEISFRFRAQSQSAHILTIRNLLNSNSLSFHLRRDSLIYRDSILNEDIYIELNNQTFEQWTTFHFQWLNGSILVFNHTNTYSVNQTFDDVFLLNTQLELTLGHDFRGCLDYVLLGENLYVPFYNSTLHENYTRLNTIHIERIDNVQINNCTFNNVCENVTCEHGQCIHDFDRGKCLCNRGWEGDYCDNNIDECQQGHNCSKEHGICQDHLDGYYTCRCEQGFTGEYCETNIDECLSSPCLNGGTCTDLINGYRCNCTNDYISSHCSVSIDDTCFGSSKTCQHNGTCIQKSDNLYVDNPQAECQCRDGYSGQWCQIDVCLQLNCQNNGTCSRLPNGRAECSCTNTWSGARCDQDIDECATSKANLCLNNSTCINTPGNFECRCLEHYYGKYCEKEHVCLVREQCKNGGICKADGEGFRCECPSKFTGTICELRNCESAPCANNGTCAPDPIDGFVCNCTDTGYDGETCMDDINECQSNPCQNDATCVNQAGNYFCVCRRDFHGFHCEQRKFFGGIEVPYRFVIWPCGVLLAFIVIILLTVTVNRVRESRRSRGTYRPALNENGQSSRLEFSMILKPPPEERLI